MRIKNIIAIALSAVLLLTACDDNNPNIEDVTVTPQEIYQNLVDLEFFDPPYMVDILEHRFDEYEIIPADYESFVAKEAAISAMFVQLIIIEAKDGKVSTVREAMETHQSNLKDDVFYPQGIQAAAVSIVGNVGNLVYLICDERSEELERELLKFVA